MIVIEHLKKIVGGFGNKFVITIKLKITYPFYTIQRWKLFNLIKVNVYEAYDQNLKDCQLNSFFSSTRIVVIFSVPPL